MVLRDRARTGQGKHNTHATIGIDEHGPIRKQEIRTHPHKRSALASDDTDPKAGQGEDILKARARSE